jgi:hypothetical protein
MRVGTEVLGLEPEAFLAAYLDSQEHAGAMALDSNIVGMPLVNMLDGRDTLARLSAEGVLEPPYVGPVGFEGTAKDLLRQLNEFMQGKPHPGRGWPRTPKGMGNALRRIAPALRKLGYTVEFGSAGRGKDKRLEITIETEFSGSRKSAKSAHNVFNVPHVPHVPHSSHSPPGGVRGARGVRGKHTQTVSEKFKFRPEAPVEAARKKRTKASPADNAPAFVPTREWQDVPDGAVLPPDGLQIEMNMTTGRNRARLRPDRVSKPKGGGRAMPP